MIPQQFPVSVAMTLGKRLRTLTYQYKSYINPDILCKRLERDLVSINGNFFYELTKLGRGTRLYLTYYKGLNGKVILTTCTKKPDFIGI